MFNIFSRLDQRNARLTLFKKQGDGWRKYQITALKKVFGDREVLTHPMNLDEFIMFGKVGKAEIARITNETKFTAHYVIGLDNPRLHGKVFS